MARFALRRPLCRFALQQKEASLVTREQPAEAYQPAVAYLRRSTDRQEQSIGDQRKAIERYADEHGFQILDFYVDDAISGTTTEQRKAFLQLIEDAGADGCPFRYVLVYDIKRFGRLDNDEARYYRFQLRRQGIEIVYVSEGFTGDDTDDLLRPVKQWQARQESKELSKVTIRGQLSRCTDGWWMGGTPPYGYDLAYYAGDGQFLMIVRYQSDCSKLLLDEEGNVIRSVPRGESLNWSKRDRCRLVPSAPERVEVVRNMFTWYARDGMGFHGIARRLNELDIPCPRGGNWSALHHDKWSMTTIRDMLLNPAYTGDMVWNRLTFGRFHRISGGRAVPRKGIPGNGPEQNRPDDWVVTRDAHPALVSRSLFEEVQQKRKDRRRGVGRHSYRSGRGATSPYLLSGLIRCQHCGHKWQGYTVCKGRRRKDGSQPKTYYYACGGYVTKGNVACRRSLIPKDLIEEWVLKQIEQIVWSYLEDGGEERLRQLIQQELLGAVRFDDSEGATIRQRLADIESTIDNLLDNITLTNREYVDRRIEKLRDEIVELERRQAALQEHEDREKHVLAIAEEALTVARDFDRLVQEGTIDERRTLVRAFLRAIDFEPESRTGVAHFWVVPNADDHHGLARCEAEKQSTMPGRGRRSDVPHGVITDGKASADKPDAGFMLLGGDGGSKAKRHGTFGAMSSEIMVARVGFEPTTSRL
jgi:DNA invertase Pin-like site-specific DNA recombinase